MRPKVQSRRLNFVVPSRFLSIVFRFSIISCIFVILISFASYFRVRNVSYFRVHFFICFFYCLVKFLLPLVFQLLLSLCFSRSSRHTNLVSFVVFPSVLLASFLFRSGFLLLCILSLFMCVCFQLIASKSANLLDVWISITEGVYVPELSV